jgi:hypothetical protein
MERQTATKNKQGSINSSSLSRGILQRKCACGNQSAGGGECGECGKNKQFLQRRATHISEPGDRYEQEADRIADEVMRMPEPTAKNQVGSEKEGVLQRKAIANSVIPLQPSSAGQEQVFEVPPIVNEVLNSPGNQLDSSTRSFFNLRFGCDFSRVRVHTDVKAAESAGALNAQAYTVGSDIVFGSNFYSPHTRYGQYLLAHELSHVVQQSAATQANGWVQRQVDKPSVSGALPSSVPTSDDTQKDDPLRGYTQCDFLNEHISYEAQRALYQLYRQGERNDALAMLSTVKSGQMQGIYKENEQKPALMAKNHGLSWWTLIPQGQKAFVFEAEKPPMMVFKDNISADRVQLALALLSAWQSSALGTQPSIIPPPSGKICPIVLPEIKIQGDLPKPPTKPKPPTSCFDSIDWTNFFQQQTEICGSITTAIDLTCSTLHPWITIIPKLDPTECSKITSVPRSERIEECVVSEGFNLLVEQCGIPMQPPGKAEIRQMYKIWPHK